MDRTQHWIDLSVSESPHSSPWRELSLGGPALFLCWTEILGISYSCCFDMFSVLAARFTQLVVDEEAGGSESHSAAAAWTARADAILKAAAKKGGNSFYISNH